MNPLLNGVPSNLGQYIGQFKKMYQMINSVGNPQQMISQMIANNPRSKEIMNYVNSFNGDYERAFKEKAKEMGINPDDFINNLK